MMTFHRILTAAALLSLCTLPAATAGVSETLATSPAALETISGKIRSVGEDAFVLTVGEQTTTINIDEQTRFELDGKAARRDQVLVEGKLVTVFHENHLASKVAARSESQALPAETVSGNVRRVGEETFVLMVGDETLTLQIDERTQFELDGKAARRDQVLVEGKLVTVTHEYRLASKIAARSESEALPAETISGKIRSVGEAAFVLTVGEETVTIQDDENTRFELDGKAARRDQVLIQGKLVTVVHDNHLASKVAARSED